MINHIWSVLCQRSVIDSKSNNISLIDIFEKLEVNLSVPVSEGKNKVKKINVPVNYEIVSLWTYDKEDQGKKLVLLAGLEPAILSEQRPKRCACANFATGAL